MIRSHLLACFLRACAACAGAAAAMIAFSVLGFAVWSVAVTVFFAVGMSHEAAQAVSGIVVMFYVGAAVFAAIAVVVEHIETAAAWIAGGRHE